MRKFLTELAHLLINPLEAFLCYIRFTNERLFRLGQIVYELAIDSICELENDNDTFEAVLRKTEEI